LIFIKIYRNIFSSFLSCKYHALAVCSIVNLINIVIVQEKFVKNLLNLFNYLNIRWGFRCLEIFLVGKNQINFHHLTRPPSDSVLAAIFWKIKNCFIFWTSAAFKSVQLLSIKWTFLGRYTDPSHMCVHFISNLVVLCMSYNLKYFSLCIKVLNVKRFFMKVRKFVNIFSHFFSIRWLIWKNFSHFFCAKYIFKRRDKIETWIETKLYEILIWGESIFFGGIWKIVWYARRNLTSLR